MTMIGMNITNLISSAVFKPMLLPTYNEPINIHSEVYSSLFEEHYMVAEKLDSVRAIIKNGCVYSQEMLEYPNHNLSSRFVDLLDVVTNSTLDGELYCNTKTSTELYKILQDENGVLPWDLKFYCSDIIANNEDSNGWYTNRVREYNSIVCPNFIPITYQYMNKKQILSYFNLIIEKNKFGLILRNPYAKYKPGQVRAGDNIGFLLLKFNSIVAPIIKIEPRKQTSFEDFLYKNHRLIINKDFPDSIESFVVNLEGIPTKVLCYMSKEDKKMLWEARDQLIGKKIEITHPNLTNRYPIFYRWRLDG